jgi:glycosyltransferase involved in cell wall biosynthesis
LRDWKGHDYLLDAWRELRAPFPEWQLLVIGDGPQRARLEARVRAEFTGDSVRFVGNREDVATWLNALDLFALPSYGDEGVPQGIMQAMACGLAVVATPVGAIEEAVQREQTGIIVEPRNAADLAHGLARLMGDPVLRKNMGAAGLRYARENFGIEIMLDRMEHVFRTATARA